MGRTSKILLVVLALTWLMGGATAQAAPVSFGPSSFLWTNGDYIFIDYPGYSEKNTIAEAINNNGQIVGYYNGLQPQIHF